MRKKVRYFTALIICCAAVLRLPGIIISAQTDLPNSARTDLVLGRINFVAGAVRAEAGEVVMFPVYVQNNSQRGFTEVHLELSLDASLSPARNANGDLLINCAGGLLRDTDVIEASYDVAANIVDVIINSPQFITGNDELFRLAIVIPDNPLPEYKLKLSEKNRIDSETDSDNYVAVDGKLSVTGHGEQTDFTTAAVTTETTASTGTTVIVTRQTEITNAPPVYTNGSSVSYGTVTQRAYNAISAIPVEYRSAGRYTAIPVTENGTESVETVTTASAVITTSDYIPRSDWSAASGSEAVYGDSSSMKTGDDGIGAAIAGLGVAAGTAAVLFIKRSRR